MKVKKSEGSDDFISVKFDEVMWKPTVGCG